MKTFDIATQFTVDLVYIIYRYFDQLAIVKPLTSRAINSERYLVCKGLRASFPKDVIAHLAKINQQFNDLKRTSQIPKSSHTDAQPDFIPFEERVALELLDVESILETDIVDKDSDFLDHIRASNMK